MASPFDMVVVGISSGSFLLPAKKWQAQAFCHYFLAGGAMPRAIANGLHYLNWNHNVDVFAHAVVVVVRESVL